MRPTLRSPLLLRLLPWLILSSAAASEGAELELETLPDGSRAVRGELLIGLDGLAPEGLTEAAILAAGGRVLERVPDLRILRVALPDGQDAGSHLPAWSALPGVSFAERNGVGEGGGLPPNDTFYPLQWHLENTGQSGGTAGADIDALGAWAIQQGSAEVVVAVLDSGIDFGHPEFQGRLLPGRDFVNEDDDPTADHPHGILVTGLLAANTNNGHGVAGVDRHCTVLPVKVLNATNGGTVMDLVQGIDYARQQGADIVSMSLINYPGATALQLALEAARAAGVILVACGGNGGIGDANASWPGASPETIAIGWSAHNDDREIHSGTGAALDFMAPGHVLFSVATSHGDTADSFLGCSAATPVAAGVVSLLLAEDPSLDQDGVFEILRLTAADRVGLGDQPGRDNLYGHGRLDARAALVCASECVGETYCETTPNSFSFGARIHARGSDALADDDFTLHARFLPPGEIGLFFFGNGRVDVAFGDGRLCAGQGLTRLYPPVQADAFGDLSLRVDLAAAGLVAGTVSHFQLWFRDSGATGFDTTDGLSVEWH